MPEAFFEPLQPPEAVQPVALVEDQVSCVLPPLFTVVGLAPSVAVGAGADCTVTVTLCIALVPPAPVHCAENVLFVVMLPIVVVPEGATVPFQSPDPEQEVASVEDQESCVLPPIVTDVGFALSVNVGNGMLEESPDPSPQPASTSAAAVRLAAAALRNMANRGSEKNAALPPNRRRLRLRHAATRARNPTLSQPSDPPPPEPLSPPPPPPPPGVTVTSAVSLALPPAPLQVSMN